MSSYTPISTVYISNFYSLLNQATQVPLLSLAPNIFCSYRLSCVMNSQYSLHLLSPLEDLFDSSNPDWAMFYCVKNVASHRTKVMVADGIKPWGGGAKVTPLRTITLVSLSLTGIKECDIILHQWFSVCLQTGNGKWEEKEGRALALSPCPDPKKLDIFRVLGLKTGVQPPNEAEQGALFTLGFIFGPICLLARVGSVLRVHYTVRVSWKHLLSFKIRKKKKTLRSKKMLYLIIFSL